MKTIKILIALLILSACKQGQQQTEMTTELGSMSDTSITDVIDNSNSLLISKSAVVFLMPDTTEINEMQAKYSEDVYIEIIADMTWYPGIAGEVLDSFDIRNQYCSKDSIIILHSDKSETILIRKDLDGDMILIHPDKEPIITYSIDFDKNQTLNYFDLIN